MDASADPPPAIDQPVPRQPATKTRQRDNTTFLPDEPSGGPAAEPPVTDASVTQTA
jgi:hypothetical protein